MKKWFVKASIIVVANSAICLQVTAAEKVPSAPSVKAWWNDIGGWRAFGTIPDVKLGELEGALLDSATMSLVTPAGALHDPTLFSPFLSGTHEAPAVPLASFADDRDHGLTARFIANLYMLGVEKLSIAYAFDGMGTKDLTYAVTNDPRPAGFQGPIDGTPLVAQGE